MKKLLETTKIKIAQYLIQKLTEYQNRKNGIRSETVSYLFNPITNEFVLDNKDNVWLMTSDVKLTKEFDRKSMMNNLILKTYNLNKSDNEKLRWMTMIRLSDFNVNLTPVLQINESDKDISEKKELTLNDIDMLGMDKL